MSDLLDRFHRVLVQEIRKNRPEYLEGRFTVAEIYQNLVPYRTHRDAIGVEMNGDYEDALLRLLAGEGDYLIIESEVARREIREELQSSNPNTGLFRDFAAADVRLTSAHGSVGEVSDDAGDGVGEPDLADLLAEAEERSDGWDGDDASGPAEVVELDLHQELESSGTGQANADHDDHEEVDDLDDEIDAIEAQAVDEPASGVEEETGDSGDADCDVCHWCRADLPPRSILNFCPFCGSDLRLTPCGECGEELEPGWRFCPGCGTEAEA